MLIPSAFHAVMASCVPLDTETITITTSRGDISAILGECYFGTTRVCPGFRGWMSRNASECSSSKAITAPASFETISQKMQPSFMGPFLLLDLFSLVRQPGKIEKEA